MSLGTLCIVLHGHLPWVLHHGSYPHGEAWLYEAAAGTYLPLVELIDKLAGMGRRAGITLGLTPVLLEQLAHERFKAGFPAYLDERRERAGADRQAFEAEGEAHFVKLAERWEERFTHLREQFEAMGRDIPAQVARQAREGRIQVLTSNATHCYMPLVLNDASLRGQMLAGMRISEKHLGFRPRGMWLPECGYRPFCLKWKPPVLFEQPRQREGIEQFMAEAGVDHFFVDTQMVTTSEPMGIVENGRFRPMSEPGLEFDQQRGWRTPLEAVGVASDPVIPRVFAFSRHPRVSEQVWSGELGYPGAGEYLEFHKKHGERGLKYWRVTDFRKGLGEKEPYDPECVAGKVFEQASHFCGLIREALGGYQYAMNRQGVVVASFDAELFGHWWYEGPAFLREVILNLGSSDEVTLATAQEALAQQRPDKVMRLPEGSWGRGGDHQVWINDQTRWMWETEYRAEERFLGALRKLPWRENAAVRGVLERAARQLLLLQASDWPFVVESRGAVDYGMQRFSGHATNFERAMAMAEEVAGGRELSALRRVELAEMDAHDDCFAEIDLGWWGDGRKARGSPA